MSFFAVLRAYKISSLLTFSRIRRLMSHRPESTSKSRIAPRRLQIEDARDDDGADIPVRKRTMNYEKIQNLLRNIVFPINVSQQIQRDFL